MNNIPYLDLTIRYNIIDEPTYHLENNLKYIIHYDGIVNLTMPNTSEFMDEISIVHSNKYQNSAYTIYLHDDQKIQINYNAETTIGGSLKSECIFDMITLIYLNNGNWMGRPVIGDFILK